MKWKLFFKMSDIILEEKSTFIRIEFEKKFEYEINTTDTECGWI